MASQSIFFSRAIVSLGGLRTKITLSVMLFRENLEATSERLSTKKTKLHEENHGKIKMAHNDCNSGPEVKDSSHFDVVRSASRTRGAGVLIFVANLLAAILAVSCAETVAQTRKLSTRLPSADKVVENYIKVIGGKKRVAAINDATSEWIIQLTNQTIGTARTQIKPPNSVRSEMTFSNGQIISASSGSSAWVLGLDGQLHTLTGMDAAVAKLAGSLQATNLLNYKKANVLARVVKIDEQSGEPAYVLEFSTRGGARLQYCFNVATGLLMMIDNEAGELVRRFEDYRLEQEVLVPHRVILNVAGSGELTLVLQRVSYNSGVSASAFDPPQGGEVLDVAALLREVTKNQDEIERRVTEYACTQKETDRELNSKGEVTKETVKAYEIFPIANREPIQKLISENGVPLSAERAAKEEKRVAEEFLKAERDREHDQEKVERRRSELAKKRKARGADDEDLGILAFLRVCELVSPRRERFAEREAIVFDFRPRPGFRPSNRVESLIAKLVGVVWIDPIDRQVIRMEARLAEGYKIAGGLLMSLRPGAAFVMEQTRMAEGVWLPRFAQINLSVKVLVFAGKELNKTLEWSDYRHFSGEVTDYKIEAPKRPGEIPE